MGASQFSTAQWPQTSVASKGTMSVNGYPAGPKDSYQTTGGTLNETDINNASVTIAPFGTLASAIPQYPDQFILGLPSGSYVPRGFFLVDESIMYNEPGKPNGYGLGLSATIMYNGRMRLSSWTTNGSGSLTTPYLNAIPIINNASGYIEFAPSGTAVAPTGFSIVTNPGGGNVLQIIDVDPLLGSTSAGGVLLYVKVFG